MPTVLILGATSDMGYAIAKKFASEGFNLQLAARNPQQLEASQSDIEIRYNVRCTLHSFDVLDYAAHASFFDSLPSGPDVTVCVVGYMNDNDLVIEDGLELQKTIHTNYTGPVSILNIVAGRYAKRGSGIIAAISSVAGNRGRGSNYIYGSAKAGFTAYLSGLRNKYAKRGVHVVTILPGFVYTKMTENLNLPKLLTAQPAEVGTSVYRAVVNKKNIVYIKWFWRWIMLIITSIPEPIFKKLKL